MSINTSNLDKEAFTISETETTVMFARRSFPPHCAPLQNPNSKERKIFSSIVHIDQAADEPIELYGGVVCSVREQTVQNLCFTDYIAGTDLKNFDTMISTLVCLRHFIGKEVVAGAALLSFGVVDEITCVQGVLDNVTAKTLHLGAAVVLKNCTIDQILFDPELRYAPLCSKKKFWNKKLQINISFHDYVFGNPIVQLSETQKPTTIAKEITIVFKEALEAQQYEEASKELISFINYLASPHQHPFNNRGAHWHCDVLESFRGPTENKCSICFEKLPPEKVVGHSAQTFSDKQLIHWFCFSCFENYKASVQASNCYCRCPICAVNVTGAQHLLNVAQRFISCFEHNYTRSMGLEALLSLNLQPPSLASRVTTSIMFYFMQINRLIWSVTNNFLT